MAPRTGPRVKVISPISGTITERSRSVSLASSVYSSTPATPSSSMLRHRTGTSGYFNHHSRDEKEETSNHSRSYTTTNTTTPIAPPPPQSGRAVLRALGLNTQAPHNTPSLQKGKGSSAAPSRTPPPPPPPPASAAAAPSSSFRTAVAQQGGVLSSVHSSGRTNGPPARDGLINFFDEAKQHRASRAAPTRLPPSSFTSTSRSVSRGQQQQHHHHPAPQEQRVRSRVEDDEAITRARTALEHAGGAVLRRPFSGINGSSNTHSSSGVNATTASSNGSGNRSNVSASTLLGGNTSSLPLQVSSDAASMRHKGMRLPPFIPITRAAGEEDETDAEGYDSDYRSDSRLRQRSWAAEATENAAALVRRRTERTHTQASPSFASPHYSNSGMSASVEGPRVCRGMFAGVSAISLNPRLFDGVEGSYADTAPPSSTTAASSQSGGARVQQRYCVRPLWSLVGTFKTALGGLVTVDYQQDCLKWSQRNPNGGHQCIRVPLSLILDVFTTKVVQEDERVEERQYTVVVRTSTRPSQVVFGFGTTTEANHLRTVLKRPSS